MLAQTNKLFFPYFLVIGLALVFVFSTNPFLRYPYDIFAHLIAIDELYHGATQTTATIQHGRLLWHDLWATIFHIFHIDSHDLFLRAKIIYTVQTSFTLFSIYYFSNVVLRNLFKKIEKKQLLYLSAWSTIIWFTIFATHSVYHHLIWNLWYSVNYQITLALFWYMTALTLTLIVEKTSWQKKLFFMMQLLILARFIIQVHSMELMYYFLYLALLALVYFDKLFTLIKKYYYLYIPSFIILIISIKKYQAESSKIFDYLNIEKFPLLYDKILILGDDILSSLNRAQSGSVNELMHFIFYLSLVIVLISLWKGIKNPHIINYRIWIFSLISAAFILIPLNQFTGGLFALIARPDVVHRMYYSSSLFLLLPLFSYYFFTIYNLSLKYLHLTIVVILISVYLFSKYIPSSSHYYAKNIQSIQNSFYPNQYRFHLSQKNIDLIGEKIKAYEEENNSNKKIFFYARTDIAFVIKYIYHKEVYWQRRRANPNHFIYFRKDIKSSQYHKVLFETPTMFPKYVPYW